MREICEVGGGGGGRQHHGPEYQVVFSSMEDQV